MSGEIWSRRKFEGAFLSNPKVLAILMVLPKVRGHVVAIVSLDNFRGRFSQNL